MANVYSPGQLKATVKAVNNEYIVLETLEDKGTIYWPLKNLPGELNVGSELTLELKNGAEENFSAPLKASSHPSTTKTTSTDQQEKLCKLLEQLVN